jgi:hypothetical protein
MKQIKKYEPTSNTQKIIALGTELAAGITDTRSRMKLSIEQATELGRLLNREMSIITKELGRGYWTSYYEIQFNAVIPWSSGRRYMRMAKGLVLSEHSASGDNKALYESEIRQDSTNAERIGIFALDFVPKKTAVVSGDKPAKKIRSHLSFIAGFRQWFEWFKKTNDYKTAPKGQIEQLRTDFKEVIEFCKTLEIVE